MKPKPVYFAPSPQGSSTQAWGEEWTGDIVVSWMAPILCIYAA